MFWIYSVNRENLVVLIWPVIVLRQQLSLITTILNSKRNEQWPIIISLMSPERLA